GDLRRILWDFAYLCWANARKGSGTLVRAVRCVGLARQFIVIWFDHTQPSPSLPMASTGHQHIGVAAVVAAPEISGCGFPAQVAVNALVIAVKFPGHVFRVFIRNVGHRFSFVSWRRKFG